MLKKSGIRCSKCLRIPIRIFRNTGEGSRGQQMYFICRGGAKAVSSSYRLSQSMSEGCYFGELCLLLSDLKRVATVYATTYCYLYTLTVDDFNTVLETFPVSIFDQIFWKCWIGYALVTLLRPKRYLDLNLTSIFFVTTLLRPFWPNFTSSKLYCDQNCTSTCASRPIRNPDLTKGRSTEVEVTESK